MLLFIYLVFYVAFNTVQVISRRVVGRAEGTGTYRSSGLCTINFRPTASNYQLSHLRPCREPTGSPFMCSMFIICAKIKRYTITFTTTLNGLQILIMTVKLNSTVLVKNISFYDGRTCPSSS